MISNKTGQILMIRGSGSMKSIASAMSSCKAFDSLSDYEQYLHDKHNGSKIDDLVFEERDGGDKRVGWTECYLVSPKDGGYPLHFSNFKPE